MKKSQYLFVAFFFFAFFTTSYLWAQDFFGSIEKKFSEYKRSAPKERIQLITDRDVYAPGELVWFNATVYNILSPNVSEVSEDVKISLLSHKSLDLFNKIFQLENGHANGFIQLPLTMKEGVYYLQGQTKNSGDLNYYYRKIVIKNNVIPQFLIKTIFPDKEYILGDQFNLTIKFQDFYSEPKRNVEYQVDFYDGKKQIPGMAGKVKKTGEVFMNVKIPLKLESGVFSYKVTAQCKVAQASLTGTFPVLTDQIFIDSYPENGKIINGVATTVRIHAYDVKRIPLAIEADLLEDGKPVLTFNSERNGLGSFMFTPDIRKSYQVQVKKPLFLDKKYDLPSITANGIALRVISKSQTQASYKLINGYQSMRSVYLIGVSDGEIFWTSTHEIDRELQVDIDLSRATGRWAHFIALNKAKRIEGEHILFIPGKNPASIELNSLESSTSRMGKNEYRIHILPNEGGKVVFTAVNSPWTIDELNNQNLKAIALPFDIGRQLIFKLNDFNESDFGDEVMEKFTNYYVPFCFGWDRVLNTKGAYSHYNENIVAFGIMDYTDQYVGKCKKQIDGETITHVNMDADNYFATANPVYLSSIYTKKKDRKPPYKQLLENGTAIMEVLQIIKPFNLQGSKIVFMGSANSINFQGGALIVIDGMSRGTDASVLNTISPYDVETISASTNPSDIQRYTGLNSVGVIEITLRKGQAIADDEEEIDENTTFTAPDYKNGASGNTDDYRSTLWWEQILIGHQKKSAEVIFYNSELISTVKGKVYYIPEYGAPSSSQFEYEIK